MLSSALYSRLFFSVSFALPGGAKRQVSAWVFPVHGLSVRLFKLCRRQYHFVHSKIEKCIDK